MAAGYGQGAATPEGVAEPRSGVWGSHIAQGVVWPVRDGEGDVIDIAI